MKKVAIFFSEEVILWGVEDGKFPGDLIRR